MKNILESLSFEDAGLLELSLDNLRDNTHMTEDQKIRIDKIVKLIKEVKTGAKND